MANTDDGRSEFSIEPGLRPDHRSEAAAGYWEAFSRKLRYPLGPQEKAVAFIEKALDPRHAISAVAADGRFLGVAGFKTPEGAFVGGGLRDLAKTYGWLSGLARALPLGILERKCEPGALLMDGIFVRPAARGLGVGSALLDAIERHAAVQGLKQVRLDVIDANPRAKALYTRRGFAVVSSASLGLLEPFFGFRSATTMVKAVR